MSTKSTNVIIVGGGVIGCGIAYELAKRGVRSTLVERGPLAREASWASAGIISPPSRPDWLAERVEISRRSLARYPSLVAELEEQTGISIDYRRPGDIMIALDEAHEVAARAVAAWQSSLGFAIAELTPAEARRREPAAPDGTRAAWYSEEAGFLTVQRLTQAFARAAAQLGATIIPETPVGEVLRRDDRVIGVRLHDQDLAAETVILATGAWTRFFGERLGTWLPTKPVKGQLIAFANAPCHPRLLLTGHGGYVRPRPDGTTIVAATEEEVGFDRRVTGEGVVWLLELTRTLCPILLHGELVDSWTGLRPGTETRNPLVGPVPGIEGLWVAAGHYRTGANEAPATAELVAASLVSGNVDPLLKPFAPMPATGGARA